MSTIGWSDNGDTPSANSDMLILEASMRIILPSGDTDIFCCLPWPSETTAPPLVWLMLTELLPVTAGLGAEPSGKAASGSDAFILMPDLPTTIAYTACSLLSR